MSTARHPDDQAFADNLARKLRQLQGDQILDVMRASSMGRISLGLVRPGEALPARLLLPFGGGEDVVLRTVFNQGEVPTRNQLAIISQLGVGHFFCDRDAQSGFLRSSAEHALANLADSRLSPRHKARLIRDHALLLIENALHEPELEPNLREGISYAKSFVGQGQNSPATVSILAEMVEVDYSLYTHSVNVCVLATAFGLHMGLGERLLEVLCMGGLYHDLGLRYMPREILEKRERLTDDERKLIRQHPQMGYEKLRQYAFVPPGVALVALQHHENLDGSGYPLGLEGQHISLAGRVVRLVDAYDAMTSRRPHKAAMPPFTAIKTIQGEMRGQISPELLKQFLIFMGGFARLGVSLPG